MTSSDPPVPQDQDQPTSGSVPPSGGESAPREPTCRIIYGTPPTLIIEHATRMMTGTMAVLSFAARTAAIPAEQLPSEYRFDIGIGIVYPVPYWRYGSKRPASGEDELASIIPVRRLTYVSPLEIVLGAPEHYAGAAILVLWAIPTIVARFSKLRARFARDRLDRDVYDALRARVRRDDVLADLDAEEFNGLYNMNRAITEDGEKTLDSDTAPTDIDDYLKFLDEHGIEEDEGFDEGGTDS